MTSMARTTNTSIKPKKQPDQIGINPRQSKRIRPPAAQAGRAKLESPYSHNHNKLAANSNWSRARLVMLATGIIVLALASTCYSLVQASGGQRQQQQVAHYSSEELGKY